MHEGEGRDRQGLQPTDDVEQRPKRLRALAARVDDLLEAVDVGSAREHVALRPPDQRPGIGSLDLVQAGVERLRRRGAEQVQGRIVQDHRRHGAIALETHGRGAHFPPSPPPVALIRSASLAISSGSPSRGIFSGSSS